MFRKDRDRRGGGVAILFKNSLHPQQLPDILEVEGIFCKVYIGKVRYVIGAVYRPPNSSDSVLDKLRTYLRQNIKPHDKLILSGDFNLPNIDWENFSSHSTSNANHEMLDIVFSFDLLQVVKEYTRELNGSKSILDLIFLSGSIQNTAICEVISGISDHRAVLLTFLDMCVDRCCTKTSFPNFSRADDESILDILDFHYDDFKHSGSSVNDLWLTFKDIVFECVERFIPKIVKKTECRNPWITRETLHLQRKLKRIKSKRAKSHDKAAYTPLIANLSGELKLQIARDKERYHETSLPTFIKTSPEKFWRLITPTSRSIDSFTISGQRTCNEEIVCSAFNNHFKSVFTCDNGILPDFSISLPPIPDLVISENGILNLLLNLDVKKSTGPDGIPNAFLKRYAEWCSRYLFILYTHSLNEGQLPDDWKIAKIKPLHKAGDKSSIPNYRPISLISTSCKILEHIIHKHIITFLNSHKVLTNVQHGFRRGFSTNTQLVEITHDFAQAINEGKQTDAIFMDFQKAFDKVSHAKLLHKLTCILQNKKILDWITAYLTNRRQFVTVKNTSSKHAPVNSGVPQGSVLGPLFFLLYINDIVTDLSVHIRLYADDCVLYEKITSVDDQIKLNRNFLKVISWCDKWQMPVNFAKTVFMRITLKKDPLLFQYSTNNTILSEVTQYKYLGLWITKNLSWSKHIDFVVAKSLRKLFFLRRSLRSTTPSIRLLAYNAIIRPILEYAVVIWDPFTQTDIQKLERVQKKVVRFIYNSYGPTSITKLLLKSKFPNIPDQNRILRLKFLFQLIKGHYAVDTSHIVHFSLGYGTRQRHNLTISPLMQRTNCFKYSFFPRTIVDWNNLHNDVVTLNTLSAFEESLQK